MPPCRSKAFPGVTGLPGGPHDLTDKALRPGCSTPSVANTAGSDMQVIVARIHSGLDMPGISDGSGAIVFSDTLAKAPAGDFRGRPQISSLPQSQAPRQQSALLSRFPRSVCPAPNHAPPRMRRASTELRFSSLAVTRDHQNCKQDRRRQRYKRQSRQGKDAIVLTTVQGEALLRAGRSAALDGRCARRLRRPWSGRRNGAAPIEQRNG